MLIHVSVSSMLLTLTGPDLAELDTVRTGS
jgi:hypothetical protein